MYKVFTTQTFDDRIRKWPLSERKAAKKISKKLATTPYLGDVVSFDFFREKRIRTRRIYYLVYDDIRAVLLVAASDKKDQQQTIDGIKEELKVLRKIAENLAKQFS